MSTLPDDWIILPWGAGLRADQAFIPSLVFGGDPGSVAVPKNSLDDKQSLEILKSRPHLPTTKVTSRYLKTTVHRK